MQVLRGRDVTVNLNALALECTARHYSSGIVLRYVATFNNDQLFRASAHRGRIVPSIRRPIPRLEDLTLTIEHKPADIGSLFCTTRAPGVHDSHQMNLEPERIGALKSFIDQER